MWQFQLFLLKQIDRNDARKFTANKKHDSFSVKQYQGNVYR